MQISGFVYFKRVFCVLFLVFVSSLDFRRFLEAKERSIQRGHWPVISSRIMIGDGRGSSPWCSVAELGTTLRIQTGGTEREEGRSWGGWPI